MDTVDAVVVGLGVGGEEVAGRLAQAGLSVVGVEHTLVGGECPYWGCIPTKIMARAGNALAEARRVNRVAGAAEVRPDWSPVARRIRAEATDNWDDRVAVDRLTAKGARFVRGRAVLSGPGRVTVDDQVYAARRAIVLATGTAAVVPPVDGLRGTPYWTNRDAVEAPVLPASMIVLGGGAVGLELAQVFARFGVRATIVERSPRLLSVEEPEASELARTAVEADGVEVHTGVGADHVGYADGRFTVRLSSGGALSAERLLVATGRAARLTDLGLATIGMDPSARFLPTDDRLRVTDGVWAVGDVTGHGAFTHMAMYEADVAVRDILGEPGPRADYHAVPRVTFTDPEIGAVGRTEQQARDAGLDVRVATTTLASSSRGFVHGPGNEGFLKLVTAGDVLVGATSAGPSGGEVLGLLALAVQARVPLATLRHMPYAYPTFHRAIGDTVRALT